MSLVLVRYVVTAAVRDRLVLSLLLLMGLAIAMSLFMGSSAVVEKDKFVAVYAAGAVRIINVLALVLFVVFFVRRSFESRDVEFMLSRPVGREVFFLSYSMAFALIGALFGAVSGVCLAAFSPHLDHTGQVLWTVSLMAENIIMVSTAFFFSMVLSSSATGAFATFGFYTLARMMTQILGIIDSGRSTVSLSHADILQGIVQGVSFFMPRLDLMAQTSWLLYGPDSQISFLFVLGQGGVYTVLIVLAALVDLRFRQF